MLSLECRDLILSLHNLALVAQYSVLSSDDSVRPRQHIGRDREADLLRCFEVDHELKFSRFFEWQLRNPTVARIMASPLALPAQRGAPL